MGKKILAILAALGFMMTAYSFYDEYLNSPVIINADKNIKWKSNGNTVNFRTNLKGEKVDYSTLKIVVFQRNTKETENDWHFQCEKNLTTPDEENNCAIWFGDAQHGNKEEYLVKVALVNRDIGFQKEPAKYKATEIKATYQKEKTFFRDDGI